MRIQEEQRKQLKAMAEKMMTRRKVTSSTPKDETQFGKDNAQRAKLKLVAKKMNHGGKTETKSRSKKTRSIEARKSTSEIEISPRKSAGVSSNKSTRRLSLGGALEALSLEKMLPPADLDESSVSTYTTLDASLNNSYNGSLETSSISLLSSSQSNNNSSVSRILGGSQEEGLDCSFFLIISNIWETVKRKEGYTQDLAEHIICRMMTLEPDVDVRSQLNLPSFRSPRFAVLAQNLIEVVEILVTMIGPDIDDDELSELGEKLCFEGVQPKLFGSAIALAMRDLLGEKEFPKDDFDAWQKAFVFVCRKMDA